MNMRVLLTGASGFVGSHILDRLRAEGIATRLLLRRSSSTGFLAGHLPHVEVCHGSVTEPETLRPALNGITHVIHCAGATKALRPAEYYAVNQQGTRNLVTAINRHQATVQRLVHISSLAAATPGPADAPTREDDPPRPVSAYGKSKLAGEREVRERCQAPFTILRPPAVYGPRDRDFLAVIQMLQAHLNVRFGDGKQAVSLVFVKDLAAAALACLARPEAAGRTYHVASPEIFVYEELVHELIRQLDTWTLPLPLPRASLWGMCALREAVSHLTGRPHILSRQKYAELCAPGWVCDTTRLRQELGFVAATPFRDGMAETLAWYRREKWL